MNCLMITSNDATEWEAHQWSVEASDLGLMGEQWPSRIPTTLGNTQPLALIRADRDSADYQQEMGIIKLTIFND